MVRKVILVAVLLGVLTVLAGCSTVEGMGRDITWRGEKGAEVFE
jgi:predicted small secreted protein